MPHAGLEVPQRLAAPEQPAATRLRLGLREELLEPVAHGLVPLQAEEALAAAAELGDAPRGVDAADEVGRVVEDVLELLRSVAAATDLGAHLVVQHGVAQRA